MFITYTPSLTATPPTPLTTPPGQVTLSYAPTPSGGAFTTTTGPAARYDLPLPRFADTGTAQNLISIAICQTTLLWPYVINIAGYDTGLAIANTSQDPFGTGTSTGVCGACTSTAPRRLLPPPPLAAVWQVTPASARPPLPPAPRMRWTSTPESRLVSMVM